jgi:hypothetical protein
LKNTIKCNTRGGIFEKSKNIKTQGIEKNKLIQIEIFYIFEKKSMRKLLFLFLIVPNLIYSQDKGKMPTDSLGRVIYTGVVQVPGRTAKQLYYSSKLWISNTFQSSRAVTDLDDPENGRIVCKIEQPVKVKHVFNSDYNSHVKFTITLLFKDGRFKYSFTDFFHEGDSKDGTGGSLNNEKPNSGLGDIVALGNWNNVKQQVDDIVLNAIATLKTELSKEPEKESW